MDGDLGMRDHGGHFIGLGTLIRNCAENCSIPLFGKPSIVLWVFICLSSLSAIRMGTSSVVVLVVSVKCAQCQHRNYSETWSTMQVHEDLMRTPGYSRASQLGLPSPHGSLIRSPACQMFVL